MNLKNVKNQLFNVKTVVMTGMLSAYLTVWAYAGTGTPVVPITPTEDATVKAVTDKASNIIGPVVMSVGGFILLMCVMIAGIEMMIHRKNPSKRVEAMTSLLWLFIGGAVIGGATLIAGTIWTVSTSFH